MEPAAIYGACRGRLLDLRPALTPALLDAPLEATPPWTVLDGYRHLAGVCCDVLDGTLDGAGSPRWTAAQLEARRGWSIDDVCSEWAARGPDLDARVAEAGTAMVFVAFDAWTHEQDIRAGAGRHGWRDDEISSSLAPRAVASFGGRYAASGAPPLRVIMGGEAYVLGDGEPDVVLRTTTYELLRIIFGRRSRAQIEAADWSGDSAAVIDAIHLFDLPTGDIVD